MPLAALENAFSSANCDVLKSAEKPTPLGVRLGALELSAWGFPSPAGWKTEITLCNGLWFHVLGNRWRTHLFGNDALP